MLTQDKLDFKDLLKEKKLKFTDDFRIRYIEEIVGVEYGPGYRNESKIGRVYGLNNKNSTYIFYDGELLNHNGTENLDGYGKFINDFRYQEGYFKNH